MITTKSLSTPELKPDPICQPFPKCLDFPEAAEIKIEVKIIKPGIKSPTKTPGELTAKQLEGTK